MAGENKGRITQVIGAVLDVRFDEGKLPEINDAIRIPTRDGGELVVEVSHGGNECGTFFQHFPDADIVCTGTQIIGAHTPNESVLVSIVQKEWGMLCLTLKGMLEYGKV